MKRALIVLAAIVLLLARRPYRVKWRGPRDGVAW
jgi:hypothetical protein